MHTSQSIKLAVPFLNETNAELNLESIYRKGEEEKKKAALLGTSLHDTTPASNYVKYSLVGLSAVVAAYFCK